MQVDDKEEYYGLIHRLLDGEISGDELMRLKLWLEKDPENQRSFDRENELWNELGVCVNEDFYETDKSWIDLSSNLGPEAKYVKFTSFLRRNNLKILLAAASIVFLLGFRVLTLWTEKKDNLRLVQASSTKIFTNRGEKANLLLPDSSEVILNSGSAFEYNGMYNVTSREVELHGEAFFDVNTNPEKPFVVQIDGMKVIAKGTQFNICSFDTDDRIEVTLEEGILEVEIDGKQPFSLNSGQQVVYYTRSKNILTKYVPADTYSSWKGGKLRFIDTPLEDVLRMIGRKYNVGFEISSRDILNMKFSATILDEPIEDVMNMFSAVTSLTFKFKEQTPDIQSQKRKIVVGKIKKNR